MNAVAKLYYRATSRIPRKLPSNDQEIQHVYAVITEALGAPDNPRSCMAFASAIKGTPFMKLKRPYRDFAILCKRMVVNEVAQAVFQNAQAEVQRRLAELTKEVSDAQGTDQELAPEDAGAKSQATEVTGPQRAQAPATGIHEAAEAVGVGHENAPVEPG